MLTRLFLTPDELYPGQRRLRAGWRLLAQLTIMMMVALATVAIFNFLLPPAPISSLGGLAAAQISTFIAINLSVFLARRQIDRRSVISLGLQVGRRSTRDILAGFLIAGVMMLVIYLIEAWAGWLKLRGLAWQRISITDTILISLVMLVVFIIVGWQEELLSRGYQLQNISDGLNLNWGILLSSLIFALGHSLNPNMNWLAAAGLFLAGMFLAFAYARTRHLWLPIGLHIGWNFFEGTVFGFPVSGLGFFGLIEHTVNGPVTLTGGAFGPEAGLVLLPALALGTILVYYYTGQNFNQSY